MMKKTIVVLSAVLTLNGCITLETEMVNANGEFKDCRASGGGFGLGMIIGAASAAASRSNCVDHYEAQGFQDIDDFGTLKLKVSDNSDEDNVVVEQSEIDGIEVGDYLLSIDGQPVSSQQSFLEAAFGPIDEPANLILRHSNSKVAQQAVRTPFKKED